MGQSRPLFHDFRLFSAVDSKHSILMFVNDCIRTADVWSRKRPLYQQTHNNFCPFVVSSPSYNLLLSLVNNFQQKNFVPHRGSNLR